MVYDSIIPPLVIEHTVFYDMFVDTYEGEESQCQKSAKIFLDYLAWKQATSKDVLALTTKAVFKHLAQKLGQDWKTATKFWITMQNLFEPYYIKPPYEEDRLTERESVIIAAAMLSIDQEIIVVSNTPTFKEKAFDYLFPSAEKMKPKPKICDLPFGTMNTDELLLFLKGRDPEILKKLIDF